MKKYQVDIWFDFANPPHVNLFRPLIRYFEDQGLTIFSTAKEFVETVGLLEKYSIDYKMYGSHGGKSRIQKVKNLLIRNIKLYQEVPDFKLSISSSFEAPEISWLKNKPSIVFDDNEIAPNWLYAKFAKHIIAPAVIDVINWEKCGIDRKKVIRYTGFKEDIYIADYIPDKNFYNEIPFRNFVTVRPENLYASYVPKDAVSIVPELIRSLTGQGLNILYLPRYEIDKTYIEKQSNIFIPSKPLNGLDVAYYSDAVLTGAGTFAREAAIFGTPAISFFAGKTLLSVDKHMVEKSMIFFSRKVGDIIEHLKNNLGPSIKRDISRSKKVQKDVLEILSNIYKLYA